MQRDKGTTQVLKVGEQAEPSLILPHRAAGAHVMSRNTGPTETAVRGPEYGNAHTSSDIVGHHRVGLVPLLSKPASKELEEDLGLISKQAIMGSHKGGKVTMPVLTSSFVPCHLALLMALQDLSWGFALVGLGIHIRNAHINDSIFTWSEETTHQDITTFLRVTSRLR